MKFSDIKNDSPWFSSEETRAFLEEIRARRTLAVEASVAEVRKAEFDGASRQAGAADAYHGLIYALQPRGNE